MPIINRCALTVAPGPPMLAWLQPFTTPAEAERILRDRSLYLIDADDSLEAGEPRIPAPSICARIFEAELELWCRDRRLWPADRSPEAFQRWFELRFHHLVDDLGHKPLQRLELDPQLPALLRRALQESPASASEG